MNREDILRFVRKNPMCFLASTDEQGAPRVRGMMTFRADDDGIFFSTGTGKAVASQLRDDPRVELCFYSPRDGLQVRVDGRAEPIDDPEIKQEAVDHFPFLKAWVEKEGYESLAVFCVKAGRAATWQPGQPFEPGERVEM